MGTALQAGGRIRYPLWPNRVPHLVTIRPHRVPDLDTVRPKRVQIGYRYRRAVEPYPGPRNGAGAGPATGDRTDESSSPPILPSSRCARYGRILVPLGSPPGRSVLSRREPTSPSSSNGRGVQNLGKPSNDPAFGPRGGLIGMRGSRPLLQGHHVTAADCPQALLAQQRLSHRAPSATSGMGGGCRGHRASHAPASEAADAQTGRTCERAMPEEGTARAHQEG